MHVQVRGYLGLIPLARAWAWQAHFHPDRRRRFVIVRTRKAQDWTLKCPHLVTVAARNSPYLTRFYCCCILTQNHSLTTLVLVTVSLVQQESPHHAVAYQQPAACLDEE